jgi:hypothetical protein
VFSPITESVGHARHSSDRDRPLTVEVELPGDVVDDPESALEAVAIRATVADE